MSDHLLKVEQAAGAALYQAFNRRDWHTALESLCRALEGALVTVLATAVVGVIPVMFTQETFRGPMWSHWLVAWLVVSHLMLGITARRMQVLNAFADGANRGVYREDVPAKYLHLRKAYRLPKGPDREAYAAWEAAGMPSDVERFMIDYYMRKRGEI
jgi:hypothetical protein